MGQDLSGLGVKGLQNLENQLEMSIRCIRTKKVTMLTIFYPSQDCSSKNKTEDHGYYFQDQLLVDEIHELNRKVLEHSTIPMKYDVFEWTSASSFCTGSFVGKSHPTRQHGITQKGQPNSPGKCRIIQEGI